ncbi:hypothetical protein SAY87_008026 [Trapa incisa]|uniref:Uncharacterized protein n=1 Tax=Trapa incisa TaxID=236973 RepID=A0AAN7QFY1_9MYRT|nr:hypothetical protein SAY87_008026 [Trapa incisa]
MEIYENGSRACGGDAAQWRRCRKEGGGGRRREERSNKKQSGRATVRSCGENGETKILPSV